MLRNLIFKRLVQQFYRKSYNAVLVILNQDFLVISKLKASNVLVNLSYDGNENPCFLSFY